MNCQQANRSTGTEFQGRAFVEQDAELAGQNRISRYDQASRSLLYLASSNLLLARGFADYVGST